LLILFGSAEKNTDFFLSFFFVASNCELPFHSCFEIFVQTSYVLYSQIKEKLLYPITCFFSFFLTKKARTLLLNLSVKESKEEMIVKQQ
jgi:hypothetical protein